MLTLFLTTALEQPKPISKKERKHRFVQDIIQPYSERILALEEFEKASEAASMAVFLQFTGDKGQEERSREKASLEEERNALSCLSGLLNEDEKTMLKVEYFGDDDHEEFKKIDVQQCRLWITKRAYELGWNSKLFARDGYGTGYSRHENDLERIGKKYQRIALDELQARLADNYWVLEGWPEKPSTYRYSHQDFRRNLEPTILPLEDQYAALHGHSDHWMTEPNLKLPEVDEEQLKQWPFKEDPTLLMAEKLIRVDDQGKPWLVLYDFNFDRQKYDEPCPGEHGLRHEEFRFFYCVFVKCGKAGELAEYLNSEQNLDVHSFRPVEFTDGPYLREAHWRGTWSDEKDKETLSNAPKGCEFTIPVAKYLWESHLDKSLPKGFSMLMPQKWFADELKVSMSSSHPHQWLNNLGYIVVQTNSTSQDKNAVIIDESILILRSAIGLHHDITKVI